MLYLQVLRSRDAHHCILRRSGHVLNLEDDQALLHHGVVLLVDQPTEISETLSV